MPGLLIEDGPLSLCENVITEFAGQMARYDPESECKLDRQVLTLSLPVIRLAV